MSNPGGTLASRHLPAIHWPLMDRLAAGLEELGIAPTVRQTGQLRSFIELLCRWNRCFNLVADSDPEVIVGRHILDCLSISPYVSAAATVADVGSGAGFPGIPLAVILPETDFILIDANGKKTRFLSQVISALGLTNAGVVNCRVEHYHCRTLIDAVTCRALSSLTGIVNFTDSLLNDGARLLAMKGRYPEQEIKALSSRYRILAVDRLKIPWQESERHLIQVAKVAD